MPNVNKAAAQLKELYLQFVCDVERKEKTHLPSYAQVLRLVISEGYTVRIKLSRQA